MVGACPGTYILLLRLAEDAEINIGRSNNGKTLFTAGHYGYVGSALGPGGLGARLKRHASTSVRKHWHIDYLLERATLLGAQVFAGRERLECRLAGRLKALATSCVAGFGASDCSCDGHLFFLSAAGGGRALIELAGRVLNGRYHPVAQLRVHPLAPSEVTR